MDGSAEAVGLRPRPEPFLTSLRIPSAGGLGRQFSIHTFETKGKQSQAKYHL